MTTGHAGSSSGWNMIYNGAGGGEGGTSFAYEYLKKGDIVSIDIGQGGVPSGNFSNTDINDGGNTTIFLNNKTYIAYGGEAGNKIRIPFLGWGSAGSGESGGLGGAGDIRGAAGMIITMRHGYTPGGTGGGSGGGVAYSIEDAIAGVDGGGGAGASGLHYMYGGGKAPKAGKGGNGVCWIEYFDPKKK